MWGQLINAGMAIGGMVFGQNQADNARASGAQAARDAANYQHQGIAGALESIKSGREKSLNYLSLYDPYVAGGEGANNLLQAALGVQGPGAQKTYFDNFNNDPGYQETLKAGVGAVEQSGAGAGMLRSGGTLKALMDYGGRLKGQMFQNRLSGLAGMSASGQSAAGAKAGMGAGIETGYGQAAGNLSREWGNAMAGGAIGVGNAEQNYAQNLLQLVGYGMGQIKPAAAAMGNDLSNYFKAADLSKVLPGGMSLGQGGIGRA